jgi:hypothetical protein
MTAIQVTWHIGSMREGDTRSTISTSTVEFGDQAAIFAQELRSVNLVMEVAIRDSKLHAKLDIGDQHSQILPWANHPAHLAPGEWSKVFHRIDAEAKKVVDTAHKLLVGLVPNINPMPIIKYERAAESTPVAMPAVAHSY